jgi:hypothetical protein
MRAAIDEPRLSSPRPLAGEGRPRRTRQRAHRTGEGPEGIAASTPASSTPETKKARDLHQVAGLFVLPHAHSASPVTNGLGSGQGSAEPRTIRA